MASQRDPMAFMGDSEAFGGSFLSARWECHPYSDSSVAAGKDLVDDEINRMSSGVKVRLAFRGRNAKRHETTARRSLGRWVDRLKTSDG
jgi:hypothetical protein